MTVSAAALAPGLKCASRIRRAAAGSPFRVPGGWLCPCCCPRRWICSGGKRLDDDPVQHRADSGAPAVGIPRFPRIADPLRRGNVAHHRGRSGEPVVFPPRGADVVFGALPDIEPVGPVDDPVGIVAARLFPPFLGVPDLLQQFRAARRVLVFSLAQRFLHARGFQRVQHRAGHVFLQQSRLDRGPAAPLRARPRTHTNPRGAARTAGNATPGRTSGRSRCRTADAPGRAPRAYGAPGPRTA